MTCLTQYREEEQGLTFCVQECSSVESAPHKNGHLERNCEVSPYLTMYRSIQLYHISDDLRDELTGCIYVSMASVS